MAQLDLFLLNPKWTNNQLYFYINFIYLSSYYLQKVKNEKKIKFIYSVSQSRSKRCSAT
ncbi:hypothetical protein Hanom_Chr05g00386131 [Helianthus anomalus]